MKLKDLKLTIGDWVTFNTHYEPTYNDQDRRYLFAIYCGQKVGQIIGAKRISLGFYHGKERTYDDNGPTDKPAFLSVTKTVILYEVKTSLIGKPLLVIPKALVPCEKQILPLRLPCRKE